MLDHIGEPQTVSYLETYVGLIYENQNKWINSTNTYDTKAKGDLCHLVQKLLQKY